MTTIQSTSDPRWKPEVVRLHKLLILEQGANDVALDETGEMGDELRRLLELCYSDTSSEMVEFILTLVTDVPDYGLLAPVYHFDDFCQPAVFSDVFIGQFSELTERAPENTTCYIISLLRRDAECLLSTISSSSVSLVASVIALLESDDDLVKEYSGFIAKLHQILDEKGST